MVVRLYFSDGSNVVRNITDEELFKFGFLDSEDFVSYLEDVSGQSVDSWRFCDNLEDNIEVVDLRDACVIDAKDLKKIDDKVVTKFEYLDINSYEYNVAILGLDHPGNVYMRRVWILPAPYEYPWSFRSN